ncbi:hypothetical protein CEB94_04835 [Streptomyces hawaiiensis]|uniref:Uncharacterized protein n=1 Tax=Streptomyces hawaiiensis TaxID=67305 RepID=A0A6G5R8W2_9ACTN|nr:hypothetical protein CEB94_04835 [Streptomyces hawaiiensis]
MTPTIDAHVRLDTHPTHPSAVQAVLTGTQARVALMALEAADWSVAATNVLVLARIDHEESQRSFYPDILSRNECLIPGCQGRARRGRHRRPGTPVQAASSLSGPGNGSDSRLTADSLLAAHPCNQLRLFH